MFVKRLYSSSSSFCQMVGVKQNFVIFLIQIYLHLNGLIHKKVIKNSKTDLVIYAFSQGYTTL